MIALSDSGLRRVFDQALEYLARQMPTQRLALMYEQEGELRVQASRGDPSLSQVLLDQVKQTGQPVLTGDVASDPLLKDSTSLLLAGIRSVLCVPLKTSDQRVCGLIYAEHDGGSLSPTDLIRVTGFARDLERRLTGQGGAWQPPTPPPPPPKPAPRPRPVEPLGAAVPTASHRLPQRSLVVMLRSLSTMLAAGLPLTRSFHVLAVQGSNQAEREVSGLILRAVEQGNTLSVALHKSSPSFTPFHLRLVRVGESSGALLKVLETLASYEEQRRAFAMRLRATLSYPLILLLICCLVLVLAPPFMMSGLKGLFDQLGGDLPASTRLVLRVSSLLASPYTLILVGGLLVGAVLAVRAALKHPPSRLGLRRLAARVPLLGPLLERVTIVRFCEALALQLRVGISVLEALDQAFLATGDPSLEEHRPRCSARLREGETLTESLEAASFFPRTMLQLLRAGEESGQLPDVLDWLARLQRLDLEARLDSLLAAAEPTILMFMGIVAAGVAWMTLEPLVSVVSRL